MQGGRRGGGAKARLDLNCGRTVTAMWYANMML